MIVSQGHREGWNSRLIRFAAGLAVCVPLCLVQAEAWAAPKSKSNRPVTSASPGKSSKFELVYRAYEQQAAVGNYAAAVTYAEEVLRLAELGASETFTENYKLTLMANLGRMHFFAGDAQQASDVFARYLVRSATATSVSAQEYLSVLIYAGTAKRRLGRYREALPLFRRALDILDDQGAGRSRLRADTLTELTTVLLALKEGEDAFDTAGKAVGTCMTLYGATDIRTLTAKLNLARAAALLKRKKEFRKHIGQLRSDLRRSTSLDDAEKAAFHREIAKSYAAQGMAFDAQRHEQYSRAYLAGLGEVRLRSIKKPAPAYPANAQQRGLTGRVVVEFTVRKNGKVADVRVVESDPPDVFDDAVLRAVRKWRYEPPKKSGVAIDYPGARTEIKFEVPR